MATWPYIRKDSTLHYHCSENLKSNTDMAIMILSEKYERIKKLNTNKCFIKFVSIIN